jgi:release factor glutamine methyltransferase
VAAPIAIAEALRQGVSRLEESRVPAPRLTAEVLLSHALAREKSFLYAHPEYQLTSAEEQVWQAHIEARRAGKPTQYITGVQEFFGLEFRVTPDVLIPRPETELLVEEALTQAAPGMRLLDVGAGSGCVAVAIAKHAPEVRVFASDLSRAALPVAAANAQRHGARVWFFQADLLCAVGASSFDIVVSNPPYVPLAHLSGLQRELRFEPALALFGGENGLDVYGRLISAAACVLRRGGWLFLELGYNCRVPVEGLLETGVWAAPRVKTDLAGLDRVLAVCKL